MSRTTTAASSRHNKSNDGNLETPTKKLGKRLRKKLNKNKEEVFSETKTTKITTDEKKSIIVGNENQMENGRVPPQSPAPQLLSFISKQGEMFEGSMRSQLYWNDYQLWSTLRSFFVVDKKKLYENGFPVQSTKPGYAHCLQA
ncbi:unnamed protein product [Macrosiphum euphorbiae]|uniref:Uncharacterized protein n=1 Tax=Macrosiphum euphorbiae TaxID=13131 RepID=A0AAV0VPP8_9HEMI|nr:unnamed protein product [Macrosiphum euphorbiae]